MFYGKKEKQLVGALLWRNSACWHQTNVFALMCEVKCGWCPSELIFSSIINISSSSISCVDPALEECLILLGRHMGWILKHHEMFNIW